MQHTAVHVAQFWLESFGQAPAVLKTNYDSQLCDRAWCGNPTCLSSLQTFLCLIAGGSSFLTEIDRGLIGAG